MDQTAVRFYENEQARRTPAACHWRHWHGGLRLFSDLRGPPSRVRGLRLFLVRDYRALSGYRNVSAHSPLLTKMPLFIDYSSLHSGP